MSAETRRPVAPEDCAAYPGCGRDARNYCACDVDVTTVPVPGPCQERALVDALHRRDAVEADIRRLDAGLSDEAIERAVATHLRERAAMRRGAEG